jgi:hypothetical protein
MCCNWAFDAGYFDVRKVDDHSLDFFFLRELRYIRMFQGKPWAPELYKVDKKNKCFFIEWGGESLSHIVNDDSRDLNTECPDWQEQIFAIVKDLYDLGYYKLTLYPHCFFLDKNKRIKTIDYYAIVPRNDPYIPRKDLESIIGEKSVQRFNDSTEDDMINFGTFFKITMTEFLNNTWVKENPFPKFYERLTND